MGISGGFEYFDFSHGIEQHVTFIVTFILTKETAYRRQASSRYFYTHPVIHAIYNLYVHYSKLGSNSSLY